ncbi:MAG: hypothetical protein VR73_13065 [Gammaproteobacteria bacterium BRH_c0]|nr:MAG: hypothetical protein VR73_13065 [Gammaproteobacteria bacterium BRH_c0]
MQILFLIEREFGVFQQPASYSLAINTLADFFEASFPGYKLTHTKGSVFVNFVAWFISMDKGSAVEIDPRRHIKTALLLRSK